MLHHESLTVRETARICRVSRTTVLNWIYAGALNAFTTRNGQYRILPADLKAFLDASGMDIVFKTPDVRRTHILIIDDKRPFPGMLRTLITREYPDIEVCIAEDVHEGLVLIRAADPQILILALELPEMSGIDFLRLIRSWEGPRNMAVVALAGTPNTEVAQQALAIGADCVLYRHSDVCHILGAVRHLMLPGNAGPQEERKHPPTLFHISEGLTA